MPGQDLNAESGFSPALLELHEAPPHPAARVVLLACLAMLAATFAWAALGQLDIVAVAEGRLIPRSHLKIVQPAEAGVVKEILVAEGDRVRAGQVLARMDTAYSEADRTSILTEVHASRLNLRRIDAQLASRPLVRQPDDPPALFERVAAEHEAELRAYRGALAQEQAALDRARHELAAAELVRAKLAGVLPHYAEQERAFADLARGGYVSRLVATDKSRERIEREQDLRAQEAVIESATAAIAAAEQRLRQVSAETERRLQAERVQEATRLDKLGQELAKQSHRGEALELKAPQDAIVKELATHTAGSVVSPGTVLLTLVPADDALRAEVWVHNDDIGFVHPGQPVQLKLAAYPFQKYGMLSARVAQVGADAHEPKTAQDAGAGLFRTVVDLDTEALSLDGQRYVLSPGMALAAEIKLGSRSVLEYLLTPIRGAFHEAGRER